MFDVSFREPLSVSVQVKKEALKGPGIGTPHCHVYSASTGHCGGWEPAGNGVVGQQGAYCSLHIQRQDWCTAVLFWAAPSSRSGWLQTMRYGRWYCLFFSSSKKWAENKNFTSECGRILHWEKPCVPFPSWLSKILAALALEGEVLCAGLVWGCCWKFCGCAGGLCYNTDLCPQVTSPSAPQGHSLLAFMSLCSKGTYWT